MQIFEFIATTRTKEELDKELSKDILEVVNQRQKLDEEKEKHRKEVEAQEVLVKMQKDEALARERLNRSSGWGAGATAGGYDSMMRSSVGDVHQQTPPAKP